MNKHEENAKYIANYLEQHRKVTKVLFPNKGGMLSFCLKESKWVDAFLRNLQLIVFAESLGGVESFITYPSTQTHADIPKEEREKRGINNQLLRFSVGIEQAEDLKADLEQTLEKLK